MLKNNFQIKPMKFENYENYVTHTYEQLKKCHETLSIDTLKSMSPKKFTAPKDSYNKNKGVLLIHGMLDSCTSMTSLYDSFCTKGFNVNSVLLPGHGTTPADLIKVKYQQWIECATLAFNDLKDHCDDITVIGLSAGAVISCYLAQTHPKLIKRLVLFAPAFELLPKATSAIPKLHQFNEFVPLIAKHWLSFNTEDDKTKYKSITTNSVFQLMTMIEKVKLNKNKIQCPLFSVISTADETVSYQSAIEFHLKHLNPKNHLVIYNNDKKISPCPRQSEVISSCHPNQNILNFSHVCMHISAHHKSYGSKPEDAHLYLGAISKQNQLNYKDKLKRLTFNPDYEALIKKIFNFINHTKTSNLIENTD